MSADRLTRRFFARSAAEVAPDLLGCLLAHDSAEGRVVIRLTEAEAYAGALDPGSHAFRGRTSRNAVMFGPPGRVYVYFTYGMHWCLNLVCGPVGEASAVLLRAGEVVEGERLAAQRRPAARVSQEMARGPARLSVAIGLDGSHNGVDATDPESCLGVSAAPIGPTSAVNTGPRVGVAGAGASQPWRFWLAGEPTVSAYRPAVSRRRRPSD